MMHTRNRVVLLVVVGSCFVLEANAQFNFGTSGGSPFSFGGSSGSPFSIDTGSNSPLSINSGSNSPFSFNSGSNSPFTIDTGSNSPFSFNTGSSSNGGSSSRPVTRAARPEPKGERVSPCFWTSQGCRPDALVWFSPAEPPSSVYHRMLMMTVERKGYCGLYKDKKACMADQKHRCFWADSQQPKCQNADSFEVATFIARTFAPNAEDIPHAITCPGSKAREFFACYAHPALGLCPQLPNCALGTMPGIKEKRCFPKWYISASATQQAAYRKALSSLDPAFFGSCVGTCWLQQSSKCLAQKKGSDCTSRPYCRYMPEEGMCFRKIWETNLASADAEVDQLYKNCYMMQTQKSCEERKQVVLQQFGKYLDWTMDSEPITCGNQVVFSKASG